METLLGVKEWYNHDTYGNVIAQKVQADKMCIRDSFYYDAQSRPAMVNFNGTYYTYLHNLQGDIVGLVDSGNNIVVEYKYDAWGKPTLKRSLTTAYDTLATLNPFRYRGYVYDEETGLYYLRNRFYNPVWGRFIGIDDTATLRFKQNNPIQYNLLSYCYNNTINMIDQS